MSSNVGGLSIKEGMKSLLLKTHRFWSKLLPKFYYPYKFGGGYIYLNIKESTMMLARALGRYENEKHEAFHTFLGEGKVFVDVGVNKGDFLLLAARIVGPDGYVYGFEPEPENCHWINKSVVRNGYKNVELQELALSDENGVAQLHLGDKSGWHSLIPGQEYREKKGIIDVKTQTLDSFLKESGFSGSVDVIKIDVEGADMHVLRGAKETLMQNKSIVILLDVHVHLGVNPGEVCEFLKEMGFRMYAEEPPFDKELKDCNVCSLVARRDV